MQKMNRAAARQRMEQLSSTAKVSAVYINCIGGLSKLGCNNVWVRGDSRTSCCWRWVLMGRLVVLGMKTSSLNRGEVRPKRSERLNICPLKKVFEYGWQWEGPVCYPLRKGGSPSWRIQEWWGVDLPPLKHMGEARCQLGVSKSFFKAVIL